jgi:hypothetical protein
MTDCLELKWLGTRNYDEREGEKCGRVAISKCTRQLFSDTAIIVNSFLNYGQMTLIRLIHTYHAVPLPCRAAKSLYCVFPIWFTQCGRIWFTYAMPRPCHATTMPFWKRLLKATAQRLMGAAWEWHGMCELTSAVQRRHVGDLPAFGFFRLPRGVPRRLLSEAYQSVKL